MGLYANQQLQSVLDKLPPVDRFPRLGIDQPECLLTLQVGTNATGHVQCLISLDLVCGEVMLMHSRPLAVYPLHMQDLAYADAMLVGIRLGLTLRHADPVKGWVMHECDDGPQGQDQRIVVARG